MTFWGVDLSKNTQGDPKRKFRWKISFGGMGVIDFTPFVFCDVTAVIAVIPYEPSAVTVFISA